MVTRQASAQWTGDFSKGSGTLRLGSGAFSGSYSFASRFESGEGTNPEELVGAAEAGCFSMALSKALTEDGHTPEWVKAEAKVNLDKQGDGFAITSIDLAVEADVPGIDEEHLRTIAEKTRENCIVSRALSGTTISVQTRLLSPAVH